MTDTSAPAGFTPYDWMELLEFGCQVQHEGFTYAAEQHAPTFESAELHARAADRGELRRLWQAHADAANAWWEAHREDGCALYHAHVVEVRARAESAMLWAVHPGGGWKCRPYLEAFKSREDAETYIASHDKLAEEAPASWESVPWRLLHRKVAGGEWTEVPR